MNKTKLWTLLGLGLGLLVIVAAFTDIVPQRNQGDLHYTISQRWELPSHLREISGSDWLEDGKNCVKSDGDFEKKLENLKDEDLRKEIGLKAREKSKEFELDKIGDELIPVYKGLI
jgi:hypothetical protein